MGPRCHYAHGEPELRKIGDVCLSFFNPFQSTYPKTLLLWSSQGLRSIKGPWNQDSTLTIKLLNADIGNQVSYSAKIQKYFLQNFFEKICWFLLLGGCRFGAKCNFAHGDAELRSPEQNLQSFQSMNDNVQMAQVCFFSKQIICPSRRITSLVSKIWNLIDYTLQYSCPMILWLNSSKENSEFVILILQIETTLHPSHPE